MVEIEFMKGRHFLGDSLKSLKDMKPVIENDNSSANIHLAFLEHCGGGGRAYLSQICSPNGHPLAVNCVRHGNNYNTG